MRCESGEDNSLSKFVILLTREGRLSGQTPKAVGINRALLQ